mgnify:CR=1 FL=1
MVIIVWAFIGRLHYVVPKSLVPMKSCAYSHKIEEISISGFTLKEFRESERALVE